MTNKSMQYLVIQGRAPQDGSEPAKALILCPAWMSATLVCAGITGRIIEMTDGSIVEGCVLPYEGNEEGLLAEIRREFEDEELPAAPPVVEAAHQEAERKIGMPPEMAAPYSADSVVAEEDLYKNVAFGALLSDCEIDAVFEKMPNGPTGFLKDWGYRQFARAIQDRLALNKPELPNTDPHAADDAYRQGAQSMRDTINQTMCGLGMPEGAKPGQWVKEQLRNLDAWRDAAGAAELCVEYDESGMVRKIFTAEESGGELTSAEMSLNTLCGAYGCLPGGDRLVWLQRKLNELVQAQGELGERDTEISQLRQGLDKIRKTAKKALQ